MFVVIYKNQNQVRNAVLQALRHLASQYDLTETFFQNNVFSTRPHWPEIDDSNSFPLWMQCEMLEWDGEDFRSVRILTIDVDELSSDSRGTTGEIT